MAEDLNPPSNRVARTGQPKLHTPQMAGGKTQLVKETERAPAGPPEKRGPADQEPKVHSRNTELRFSVPYDHHIVIKVLDKDSGEVISTIPPLADRMKEPSE